MYKVLLVDDEPVIIEGLMRIVKWDSFGCEVVATASNALEGTQAICKHVPDILVTDIKMPGGDGLLMLAALRSEFPNMQVTVLSGYSDFSYVQKAITLGVCRYLLKPSKMAELDEAVSEMVKRLNESELPAVHEQDEITSASSFVVRNALECINERYMHKLSLADVADKCYVSQWHLSKLLNRVTCKNFYDLLNEARIKKAKELLEDPSLRICDICEMVGYSDAPHFSRVFKKTVGVSANEYRNQTVKS